MVRPRPDGADDFVRLRRGEDEADVWGRLLDQLEQRVERSRRDHVGLVDDVDLVATADGGEERAFPQVTRLVDVAVRGGVDLDDVDAAGPAAGEVATALALAAGVGHRRLFAVQRAGQDAGAGGLAAAARPGEEVGVVDAVAGECVPQRLGDVVLADDLGKRLGPVPAVEGEGCIHACSLTTKRTTAVDEWSATLGGELNVDP